MTPAGGGTSRWGASMAGGQYGSASGGIVMGTIADGPTHFASGVARGLPDTCPVCGFAAPYSADVTMKAVGHSCEETQPGTWVVTWKWRETD